MQPKNVKELLVVLNALVSDLPGKRVGSRSDAFTGFSELHKYIADKLNPYLNPLGLEYGSWNISRIQRPPMSEDKLFRLWLPDFKEDKNAPFSRRGRIVKVEIKSWAGSYEHYTLEEYIAFLDHCYALKLLDDAKKHVFDLQMKLDNAIQYRDEMQVITDSYVKPVYEHDPA